jgi:hypothetical protein
LTVTELTKDTRCTSRGFDLDALLCSVPGDKGIGTKAKSQLGESVLHID